MDESKRRQRLEQVNYQLFSEDMLNGADKDDSALGGYTGLDGME